MSVVKNKPKVVKSTMDKKPVAKENKELAKLVSSLNTKFGANAINIGFSDEDNKPIERVSTGSIVLDIALGGGIPLGRFTEISGAYSSTKTTQSLHIIREAQKMGLVCALVDVEGTSDEKFIKKLGIDTSTLLYSRPDGTEEATQLILDMQRSKEVHLVVLDSIAAMSPNKEQETGMDETMRMGIPQQLLGEFFRKFQANNNRLDREGYQTFTLIGVNQLREKIGVYGDPEYCVHYDTPIPLVDGRTLPIGEIVDNKIKAEVWSYNFENEMFEAVPILDWRNNGNITSDREYYTLITNGAGSKNGVFSVTTTFDHLILTDSGWKETQDLTLMDKMCTKQTNVLNGTLHDFMSGTFVGDCTLIKSHKNTSYFRFQDKENPEYLGWKVKKISKLIPLEKYPSSNMWRSNSTPELSDVKEDLGKRDPMFFLRRYSDLGLALFYMDDGSLKNENSAIISIKRLKNQTEKLAEICNAFGREGLPCTYQLSAGTIAFNVEVSREFFSRISKYVPKSMQYKLPKNYQGLYQEFELTNSIQTIKKYVDITSIKIASKRKLRRKGRYDIHVGENQNFLAGGTGSGVVVHNSPGGRAKGFVSSIDLRLRRGDWIAQGKGDSKEIVGQVVKFKIDKNKTARRMTQGEFDFYFAENDADVPVFYNDNTKEIIMVGVEWGIIDRAGSWFHYAGEKYQGVNALTTALKESPELMKKIKDEVVYLMDRKSD